MSESNPTETMTTTAVTYTIEIDGQVIVIEHVPARVCIETGEQASNEQFFSPETVERIHAILHGGRKPARTIQTPVYEFAA